MRSRYSAFGLGDIDYLRHSWDPDRVPVDIRLTRERWTGLVIHETTGGGAFDSEATVRFTAAYLDDDGPGEQSENSLFRRFKGRWVYVAAVGS